MTDRKPVAEMSSAEHTAMLDQLASQGDLRRVVAFLVGYAPAAIDTALTALKLPRAPVTGDDTPHFARGDESTCLNQDSGHGYICLAQAGHAGPVHVAYGPECEVVDTWPAVTGDEPVPYVPAVPHLHTFSGGQCTQCPVTLTGWAAAAEPEPDVREVEFTSSSLAGDAKPCTRPEEHDDGGPFGWHGDTRSIRVLCQIPGHHAAATARCMTPEAHQAEGSIPETCDQPAHWAAHVATEGGQ